MSERFLARKIDRLTSQEYKSWAYLVNGAYCWRMDRPGQPIEWRVIDPSTCHEYGIDKAPGYDPAVQAKARDKYVEALLMAHVRAESRREPSAEQMYEMRSAFGKGTTVVNVFTGRRTRL